MQKFKKLSQRKLSFSAETLRTLTFDQLARAGGGQKSTWSNCRTTEDNSDSGCIPCGSTTC